VDEEFQALKKAAITGDVWAQFELGGMYRLGHGVRRNRVVALKWFILAAWSGDCDADLQCELLSDELTECQERRAVAGALQWKFRNELERILQELLMPGTTIRNKQQ